MRKFFSALVLAGLVLGFGPETILAATSTVYATATTKVSNQVYHPENMIGSPDQEYGDFFSSDASITLDLGAGVTGTSALTLYYQLLNFGSSVRIYFQDENFYNLHTAGATLNIGQTEMTIDYPATTPYRYIQLHSGTDQTWRLDAISTEVTETAAETPIDDTSSNTESAPESWLVKLADDGNPATTLDEAVYLVSANGQRHAFPNAQVFFSWFPNFDEVSYIDEFNLSVMPLGKNVTVRSGTNLIKLANDPKTYAVEAGGALRWIKTEEIARILYGADWAKRVIDMPDVFFTNYSLGEPIETADYPNGVLAIMPSGEMVYLRDHKSYSLPGNIYAALRFDSRQAVSVSVDLATKYPAAGDLTAETSIKFPY